MEGLSLRLWAAEGETVMDGDSELVTVIRMTENVGVLVTRSEGVPRDDSDDVALTTREREP